jgi:hypothetical protein
MPESLLGRIGDFLHRKREWHQLPRLLAMARLVEIRNELREKNLHDVEDPPLAQTGDTSQTIPHLRPERTVDGSFNDLRVPAMGSAGRRFGRNVPLQYAFPDPATLFDPNPRVVSRELMTRDTFKPARILNLMAASWLQFMVHDWFVHKRSTLDEGVDVPLAPGDDWPAPRMRVPRSVPDPSRSGTTRPPAYVNLNSHWWDGSQIYGSDEPSSKRLRSGAGGKLTTEANGLLPLDPVLGVDATGFNENWWIGLAMLHTLFVLEHNHICDLLSRAYPSWTDDRLYAKARLINAGLMAKIHTVEWTPAILPHPVVELAMNANWFGIIGSPELQQVLEFINEDELLGGIIGSRADHHAVPYSLTEEFVAVYRMHPLMPDELVLQSARTGAEIERHELPEMSGRKTRGILERVSMPDLFYSFGVAHPGAVTLHNYPRHLQDLRRDNGEHFDLAAVDILRDRERGVPRYNQFRRLFHKKPVPSIDELTDNAVWREEIRRVYANDVEKVDLMTGLYAEPLPEGFGFSETAFRVFILMASRRLKSDRFFTDDYRPEIYTELGIEYIRDNGMASVLKRHVPGLEAALAGVKNPFAPWCPVSNTKYAPAPGERPRPARGADSPSASERAGGGPRER